MNIKNKLRLTVAFLILGFLLIVNPFLRTAYTSEYQDGPAGSTVFVYLPAILYSCPLLYQDNFENPDSGWPVGAESDYLLEYLDGKYRMWLDFTSGWVAARPDFLADDYSLAVDLQNVSGVYGTYGLIFGLSDDWNQFYTFEIDPQGYYSIFLSNNDNWTLLGGGFSAAIKQGGDTNHLKIVRDGTLIEAWVNGQLLTSISNGAYTGQRYLGLIASTYDDPKLDIRYDNFLVGALSCGTETLKSSDNPSLTRNWERREFVRSPLRYSK